MKATNTSSHRKISRIAFWSYDLYPYVLSGKIVASYREGPHFYYEIEGYGKGNRFAHHNMLAVINGEIGEQIHQQIMTLGTEHRQATAVLHAGFVARALAAIPFEVPNLKR